MANKLTKHQIDELTMYSYVWYRCAKLEECSIISRHTRLSSTSNYNFGFNSEISNIFPTSPLIFPFKLDPQIASNCKNLKSQTTKKE